jgi:hypothetical protein
MKSNNEQVENNIQASQYRIGSRRLKKIASLNITNLFANQRSNAVACAGERDRLLDNKLTISKHASHHSN